ncbi:MAG: thioesterase family protein [Sphingomonas sp.]
MRAPAWAGPTWHEIDYRAEIRTGALIELRGRITAVGRTSIQSEVRLVSRSDDRLHATLAARTVRFDLAARASVPIDAAMRDAIAVRFAVDA